MRTFKDCADRDWNLAVNVAAIKRLRDLLKVDLMQVVEGDLLQKLYVDPVLLVDVLYVLCKPQADPLGVTDEQFGEAMAGDAIEAATAALVEEIIDFFPNRRDRDRLRTVLAKIQQMAEQAHVALDAKVESPEFQQRLDQIVANVGERFTDSPA